MYETTPSVIMTSYPIYMVSPILLSWQDKTLPNISPTIFHITSTVAVSLHPLYQWHHNQYGSRHLAYRCHHTHSTWHHIHNLWHQCSVFMTSQPLYSWYQISYIWCYNHSIWHLIPYTCDITATISVSSHPLCLGSHIQYVLTSNTQC